MRLLNFVQEGKLIYPKTLSEKELEEIVASKGAPQAFYMAACLEDLNEAESRVEYLAEKYDINAFHRVDNVYSYFGNYGHNQTHNLKALEVLFKHKLNPNLFHPGSASSAFFEKLDDISSEKDLEIIKLFVKYGAKFDPISGHFVGLDALQRAIDFVFSENKFLVEFVKIALANGVNPLYGNLHGCKLYEKTTLHIALNNAFGEYLKEISTLLVKHMLENNLEIPDDLQNNPKILEILSENNKRATAAFILGCKDKKNSMLYKFFNGPLSDENIIREIHAFKLL